MNRGPSDAAKVEMINVLYAVADIPPGVELTEDYVAFKEMPIDVAPEGAVTDVTQYEKRALKIGSVAGETIMRAKLGEPGERGVSMAIPDGMRVIAVSVDETKTFSSMLAPGDRVDLIVTFKQRMNNGQSAIITNTLLEYVEVFATDNQTASKVNGNKGEAKTKTVSLLVTPEQMNYVKLAEEAGTLTLAWRHRTDDAESKHSAINESLLVQLQGIGGTREREDRPAYDDNPYEPVEEPIVETVAEEEGTDLRAFLNSGASAEPEPVEPVIEELVETVPATPTWRVEVRAGGESVAYEVDDPSQLQTKTLGAQQGGLETLLKVLW
jgi:pilus assembly protein CpaB